MRNQLTKALVVSAIIACAVMLSGCLSLLIPQRPEYPSDEVFEQEVTDLVCGENIKALGDGNFSPLDRDLEFFTMATSTTIQPLLFTGMTISLRT